MTLKLNRCFTLRSWSIFLLWNVTQRDSKYTTPSQASGWCMCRLDQPVQAVQSLQLITLNTITSNSSRQQATTTQSTSGTATHTFSTLVWTRQRSSYVLNGVAVKARSTDCSPEELIRSFMRMICSKWRRSALERGGIQVKEMTQTTMIRRKARLWICSQFLICSCLLQPDWTKRFVFGEWTICNRNPHCWAIKKVFTHWTGMPITTWFLVQALIMMFLFGTLMSRNEFSCWKAIPTVLSELNGCQARTKLFLQMSQECLESGMCEHLQLYKLLIVLQTK